MAKTKTAQQNCKISLLRGTEQTCNETIDYNGRLVSSGIAEKFANHKNIPRNFVILKSKQHFHVTEITLRFGCIEYKLNQKKQMVNFSSNLQTRPTYFVRTVQRVITILEIQNWLFIKIQT